LGNIFEIHKHRHNFVKGHNIGGRIGQIEPLAMKSRHDELVIEMQRRGYNHKSTYEQPDLSKYDLDGFIVNRKVSELDLVNRCSECKKLIEKLYNIRQTGE